MKIVKTILVPITCMLGLCLSAQSAFAAALEEIVVTAAKRESALQDIPMSVSAITGNSLEHAGVADFTDIATSVPSVSFRSGGPGRTKLNIRGISAATGVAPTVSFYLDEMPIQSISSGSTTSFAQAIVDPKMYDLERVEVLRGPQGTLYGSSSMGGTIRLITRQPDADAFDANVSTSVSSTTGGGTNFMINGMVNAPLADNLALRVVASYTDNDGYFDSVDINTGEKYKKNVNTEESVAIRAALRWNINDNAYLQPSVFTQTTEMDGKPNYDRGLTDMEQLDYFPTSEPFDDEFTITSLTYSHDFAAMSLLANYSQIDRKFKNTEDITNVGVNFFGGLGAPAYSDELVDLDDETIEIRLTSNSDSSLQWLVGFYRKDATVDASYRMARGWDVDADGEDLFANGLANTQKLQEYEEDALFGELTYHISDSFSITAGLRSLDYDFHSREENWGGVFTNDGDRSTANVRDAKIGDSDTSEKLTLNYQFGDDNQIFLTHSTGSRPGAINRVIPRSEDPDVGEGIPFACNNDLIALGVDDPAEYLGDDVTNTEFGWKMGFGDSVRLNGAVYDVTWDNIQQLVLTSSTCGNNFTGNLGKAKSTGLELEFTAAVGDNGTVGINYGYVDSRFDESHFSPESIDPDTGEVVPPVAIVTKGDSLPDVPEFTLNVSFDYAFPVANGEVYTLTSWNYVDKTQEAPGRPDTDVTGPGIDSGNIRPAYQTIDLRVGYISESGWEAALFAENLFNEEALYGYNDAIAFNFNDGGDPTVRNRPRTIGVSFMYPFN